MAPSLNGVVDFFLTPFTYMMPTFLGFQKTIPTHLAAYNHLRAGIDIEYGEGNVFPGLVGDFWLLFGPWMPLPFACFVVTFCIAQHYAANVIPNGRGRSAFELAALSYLFFCFRNITGALVLVLVLGLMILWISTRFSLMRRPRYHHAD
jgi:hypothetical protein